MESSVGKENPFSQDSITQDNNISHIQTHSQSDKTALVIHMNKENESMNAITPTECIDHLKFLAAVAELQRSIRSSDGLFGINEIGELADMLNDADIRARMEEKRWQVYVSRAVDRFREWWVSLPKYKKQPTVMSLKRYEMNPLTLDDNIGISLSEPELPPLDILMVWHSFMLNPRAYLEDCFRQAKMNLWATPFPWDLVTQCISMDDEKRYYYHPSEKAHQQWNIRTGRKWDNLEDPLHHALKCPFCHKKTRVLWTKARITMLDPTRASLRGMTPGFENADGYADKSFSISCSGCHEQLDHDYLSFIKFRIDNIALIKQHLPLPGTLYDPNGVVKTSEKGKVKWPQLTPNYLFLDSGREFGDRMGNRANECRSVRQLADLIYEHVYRHNRKIQVLDMDSELANSDMFDLPEDMFNTSKGKGRGTLRRMMSRYWGNSSMFAIDLVGAVIRQGSFVQKMQKLNWLHSRSVSALHPLMEKFITKYYIFWKIIVDNPSQMVVPTLDVDLVWHTHQLNPKNYYTYSIKTTERRKPVRFIDHNDRIDEGRLSDSFEWTVRQYRKVTGGELYSECFCWYCEATRGKRLFEKLSLSSKNIKELDQPKNEKNDTTSSLEENVSTHISPHNAVRAPDQVPRRSRQRLERIIREHHRRDAVNGKGLKTNKNQNERTTLFELFEKDPPLHHDVYINNPACLSMGKDAVGNCIGGSCSPSMAAGSCGGSTFTSLCASGAKKHGTGFGYMQYRGAGGVGGGGGVGCGGGC
ncbi:conserved hypothetical protein [Talaromyces stipitatus ATCC 10500]|uniref:Alpha-ketoglutarate-dependent sulfonate dioxygenase n=1 Tax=Talaromyces stipitatus (strain ATCC 10500 / CBS 375.48 / QM 6759 / NRRL 1006) TaxID=441959 RepID=B8MVD9_TALSN|nr:uncharacterized protein TSTA_007380 [Talaromyces stipitatus ATCC 10500]EED11448.1 conserved hypothetical protein [Talaromyces stipitatus ATCC 10500]